VEKFSDFMVLDTINERCYRADKYLTESLKKILAKGDTSEDLRNELSKVLSIVDTLGAKALNETFQKYGILSEDGNPLSYPEPFNLMFSTSIGPSGKHRGFLRPETAQGIFVNFKNLYDFNRNRLPFAAAQIGLGFRNEISPRDGLLRVREFTMAEIEHFVNPKAKNHSKFASVRDQVLPLYSQGQQEKLGESLQITIGEAVQRGIVNNETLGYYIVRTYLFLVSCGVRKDAIRFRQHLADEMAHYAADCWDAEILNSYGWVECVGIADRSCYDLSRHSEKSKKNLQAAEKYEQPLTVEFIDMKPNKGEIAKVYKQKTQEIVAFLAETSENVKSEIWKKFEESKEVLINVTGNEYKLEGKMIAPVNSKKTITQEVFYPSVIEPSFGIGRIIYSVLEHAYRERENLQEARSFLKLNPIIAPIKCCLLPLSKNDVFEAPVNQLKESIKRKGLSCEVDYSSSTIGKRYARCDEVGIPFAVTVDFQTQSDQTVTLREAAGMTQVRIPMSDVAKVLRKLVNASLTWEHVSSNYPSFAANTN
jgi:glycyl-tRNA synthetase